MGSGRWDSSEEKKGCLRWYGGNETWFCRVADDDGLAGVVSCARAGLCNSERGRERRPCPQTRICSFCAICNTGQIDGTPREVL